MFYSLSGGHPEGRTPIGHSDHLLIKVPFTGHTHSLESPPKCTICTQTSVSGPACEETPTIKTSISASNNVSAALGSTTNHDLTLLFCPNLFVTRTLCRVGSTCKQWVTAAKLLPCQEMVTEANVGDDWFRTLVLVIYSSAGSLASVMIGSSHVK